MAQGTLYPDVIESVSFSGGPSVTIKSHHNVGGLPEKMGLKLVEPLRELFKDDYLVVRYFLTDYDNTDETKNAYIQEQMFLHILVYERILE